MTQSEINHERGCKCCAICGWAKEIVDRLHDVRCSLDDKIQEDRHWCKKFVKKLALGKEVGDDI